MSCNVIKLDKMVEFVNLLLTSLDCYYKCLTAKWILKINPVVYISVFSVLDECTLSLPVNGLTQSAKKLQFGFFFYDLGVF